MSGFGPGGFFGPDYQDFINQQILKNHPEANNPNGPMNPNTGDPSVRLNYPGQSMDYSTYANDYEPGDQNVPQNPSVWHPKVEPGTLPYSPDQLGNPNGPGGYSHFQETNAFKQAAPVVDYYRSLAGEARGQERTSYLNAQTGNQYQTAGLDNLYNASMGRGPSAAQAQLQQGRDAALQNAMAIANSARGNPQALAAAQSAGAAQGFAATQQAANQSAILRAQEQQAAMAAFQAGAQGYTNSNINAMGQAYGAEQGFENMGFQAGTQQLQSNSARDQLNSQNYISAGNTAAGISEGSANRQQQAIGSAIAGAATVGAAISDRRMKEDIHVDRNPTQFLDDLTPYLYRYRPESGEDHSQRLGIMAQDLEKTPQGRNMIVDTPAGKAVDTQKAFTAMMAAQADINKRLKKIESQSLIDPFARLYSHASK